MQTAEATPISKRKPKIIGALAFAIACGLAALLWMRWDGASYAPDKGSVLYQTLKENYFIYFENEAFDIFVLEFDSISIRQISPDHSIADSEVLAISGQDILFQPQVLFDQSYPVELRIYNSTNDNVRALIIDQVPIGFFPIYFEDSVLLTTNQGEIWRYYFDRKSPERLTTMTVGFRAGDWRLRQFDCDEAEKTILYAGGDGQLMEYDLETRNSIGLGIDGMKPKRSSSGQHLYYEEALGSSFIYRIGAGTHHELEGNLGTDCVWTPSHDILIYLRWHSSIRASLQLREMSTQPFDIFAFHPETGEEVFLARLPNDRFRMFVVPKNSSVNDYLWPDREKVDN